MHDKAIKLAKELYPADWIHHVSNIEMAMYTGSVLNMQTLLEDQYKMKRGDASWTTFSIRRHLMH
jgi:hypothetical protein